MRYNARVRWLGLALLLAACGQDDFVAPNLGNLKKDPPYDFAASKYPRDLGVVLPPDDDGGANLDAGVNVDLAAAPDLRKVNEHPDDMMP
jgi:hypothetical protein